MNRAYLAQPRCATDVSRKAAKFEKDKKVKGKLPKARGLPICLAPALFLALSAEALAYAGSVRRSLGVGGVP